MVFLSCMIAERLSKSISRVSRFLLAIKSSLSSVASMMITNTDNDQLNY